VTLTPTDNGAANVYWTVDDTEQENALARGGRQFQLHLYDVTDIPPDSVATHSVQQYDFKESISTPQLLTLEGNRDYFAEIGYLTDDGEWLMLARSHRVRIPASISTDLTESEDLWSVVELTPEVEPLPSLSSIPCSIALTLDEEGAIDAHWEVPEAAKTLAKQQGGQQFQVWVYDVTNTTVEISPSFCIEKCLLAESINDWQFELESEREYLAEIGYVLENEEWLMLARSNRVFVPGDDEDLDASEMGTIAAALTGVGLAAGTAISAMSSFPCEITLSLGDDQWVDARWEVPDAAKERAKQQGGEKFQLHVYEVTGIDLETQSANSVQRYNCNELIKQWQIPNLITDCEYIAEIGYVTDADDWLMLARSNRIRVPISSTEISDGTGVSPVPAMSSEITLTPRDNPTSADAHWEVPRAVQEAAKQQGGQQFQLRLYDVTGVDLQTTPASNVRRYNCHELIQQLQIPNLEANRDYFAEIGYVTDEEEWLMLARSNSVGISASSQTVSQENLTPAITTLPVTAGNCAIEHLTVHSRRNCFLLDEERMKQLQEKAVSQTLEPGIYVLRIKSGLFGYGGFDSNSLPLGEPMVIFWLYGGKVINKKTRVPVGATWSTLNGFHETLTLEVQETTTLCAFFFDSFPDDNQGEVTVSVARLYDAIALRAREQGTGNREQ
jgi:hypothetical protein